MYNKKGYVLNDSINGILLPIFNKGDLTGLAYYTPIRVFSHARNVMEAVLAMDMLRIYSVHLGQLGFRESPRMESASVVIMHTRKTCAFRPYQT